MFNFLQHYIVCIGSCSFMILCRWFLVQYVSWVLSCSSFLVRILPVRSLLLVIPLSFFLDRSFWLFQFINNRNCVHYMCKFTLINIIFWYVLCHVLTTYEYSTVVFLCILSWVVKATFKF